MYDVKVFITLKEAVIDPQGKATHDALQRLGFKGVENVRIGKVISFQLDGAEENVEETVKEMCENLLVNKIVEEYRYTIEEVVS